MCERPNILAEEIPGLVERLYGLKVIDDVRELDSYYDKNFRLQMKSTGSENIPILPRNGDDDEGGKQTKPQSDRFMIKIINKYRSAHLKTQELRNDVLNHTNDFPFQIPRLVQTLADSYQTVIRLNNAAGETDAHVVKLYEYIEGTRLDRVCLTTELCRQMGSIAGQLDKQWMTFPIKTYNVTDVEKLAHMWILSEVPRVRDSYQYVQDQSRVDLIEQVVVKFETDILDNAHTFTKGLIHGDVADQNALVRKTKQEKDNCQKQQQHTSKTSNSIELEPLSCPDCREGAYSLIGVIDFGDLSYSCYLYELAVSCAYISINADGVPRIDAIRSLVGGYSKYMQLPMHELEYLRVAICARLVQSFVNGQLALSLTESNSYTQNHASRCWPSLMQLWPMENADFLQLIGCMQKV